MYNAETSGDAGDGTGVDGARILVIDDEESLRYTFGRFLGEAGYAVTTVSNHADAVERIETETFDLIFADILLGPRTGIEFLENLRSGGSKVPVVMVTGYPNLETASEAVRLGAFDYLQKPVTQKALLAVAGRALRHKRVLDENERYRSNLETIFGSVHDAIVLVDGDMRVQEVNRAAENLCGLRRDRAVGQEFTELSMGCKGPCMELIRSTLESGTSSEIQRTECRPVNGGRHVVTLLAVPLREERKDQGAVLIIRDETRVVQLEESVKEAHRFKEIIGRSEAMDRVYGMIDTLADLDVTVLLCGETGTGKELVADALHNNGPRKDNRLVKVNCAALSENILESELFGHVRGSFTGAVADRIGRFERADGGTIFLDEISEISPRLQLQLLRVIQEKEFERVGDATPIKVDVRIIAATNRDLRAAVADGTFREDLYYRLKVVELELPPLRERRSDIALLVDHFLSFFNEKYGRNVDAISSEVRDLFFRHPWPGNVRQLRHILEHAVIMCRERVLSRDYLPPDFLEIPLFRSEAVEPSNDGTEAATIRSALKKAGWNKAKAARILGMSRQTLYRRLRDLGIEGEEGAPS